MRLIFYTLLYFIITPIHWAVSELSLALTRLWSYALIVILKERMK